MSGQFTDALRMVLDPELSLAFVELGPICGIEVERRTVRGTMTLTTPGCPLLEAMTDMRRGARRSGPLRPRRRVPDGGPTLGPGAGS